MDNESDTGGFAGFHVASCCEPIPLISKGFRTDSANPRDMDATWDRGMIVEKAFCEEGLAHGNTKTWSLVFDAGSGKLKVRISSTSTVGPTQHEEEPLSGYLARIGNSKQRRRLRNLLGKVGRSIASLP